MFDRLAVRFCAGIMTLGDLRGSNCEAPLPSARVAFGTNTPKAPSAMQPTKIEFYIPDTPTTPEALKPLKQYQFSFRSVEFGGKGTESSSSMRAQGEWRNG